VEELTINIRHHLIRALAVTPDDRYRITASEGHGLKVWDLREGTEVSTLRGHKARVDGLARSSDARYGFSASTDHSLKVWSIEHNLADSRPESGASRAPLMVDIWALEHQIIEPHTPCGPYP